MLDLPELTIGFVTADQFEVDDPSKLGLGDRIQRVAERWAHVNRKELEPLLSEDQLPSVSIQVIRTPPLHSGFGVGTQLAFAVVAGLDGLFFERTPDLMTCVQIAERGQRSSIGSHGFFRGGMIVDRGKFEHEPISTLERHVHVPDEWRFVIACGLTGQGLSGGAERKAFRNIRPVPTETTAQLQLEIQQELLPAIETNDFDRFAAAIWRYGTMAGECFGDIQGGCFNGPIVSSLVEQIRKLGYEGVGQSSWGPAVFTVVPNQEAAEQLRNAIRAFAPNISCWTSHARNRGVEIAALDSTQIDSLKSLAQ